MRNTDTSSALKYIREAEIILHNDSINDGAALYYIYGLLLRLDGDIDGAIEALRRSIDLEKRCNSGNIRAYIEYSDILLSRNDKSSAIALLDTALYLTDTYRHNNIFRHDVLYAFAATYQSIGNKSLADKYRNLADKEKNAHINAEREIAIQQIKSKYDLERADNEVNRQQIQLLEKQRTLNLLLFVMAIAIILVTCSVYMYRRKSRLYDAIVRRTTEAAREEAHLRDTISRLEATVSKLNHAAAPSSSALPSESSAAGSTLPYEGEHSSQPIDPALSHASAGIADTSHKTGVSSESLARLSAQFESLIHDPAVFTDSQISKDKIAATLGTNRTYVSKIVNDIYGMSFPQFINSLRIKEAVRRLSDPKCDTPLKALSAQLGYNSITTFYSKFSESTGMTPASFREKSRDISRSGYRQSL